MGQGGSSSPCCGSEAADSKGFAFFARRASCSQVGKVDMRNHTHGPEDRRQPWLLLARFQRFAQWPHRVLLAVGMGVSVVLFTPLTEILYRPLIVDEVPGQGELIVIFAAGIYPDGLPDFSTMVRLRKGVDLYRQHAAPKIMTLGGGPRGKSGLSYAELMAEDLVRYHRIPREDILSHSETSNTYADITSMVARFKDRFNFNRSIYVSSAYHTYRIKRLLLKKNITGPVVAAEPYELTPLRTVDRMVFFREVSREYLALFYSRMRGWLEI